MMLNKYIRPFVYLIPAWFSGGGLLLTILLEVSRTYKSRLKITYCLLFFVFLLYLLLMVYFQSTLHQGHIYSSVSDIKYRELITLGWYPISGDINYWYLIKFVVAATLFTLIVNNFRDYPHYEYAIFIRRVVNAAIFLSFVYFVSLYVFDIGPYLKMLVGQGETEGANNHLTRDMFGYRISLGFYEPSQMSTFLGSILALNYTFSKELWKKIGTTLVVFSLFMLSRSSAIMIVFFLVSLVLNNNRMFSVMLIAGLFFFVSLFPVIKGYLIDFSVFRSIHERSLVPDFENITISNILFGFDYGNVYSFIPGLGVIIQIGILGYIAIVLLFIRHPRTLFTFIIIYTLAPQTWYTLQMITLSFVFIAERIIVSKKVSTSEVALE
ncbi:hypothetical protein KW478_12790 [Vibrio fluvialis]|nr:hypothetical protein [Vibrio fluvialis]MBY8084755.1 hypothetical protein [Vibrio fluvialis]